MGSFFCGCDFNWLNDGFVGGEDGNSPPQLKVRADDGLKRTPFIMVTAESKTENVIAAKKAGVNNYIVKPFNAATLKQKITAVLGDF